MTIVNELINDRIKELSDKDKIKKKVELETKFKLFGVEYSLHLAECWSHEVRHTGRWYVGIYGAVDEDTSTFLYTEDFKKYKDAYDYYTQCLGCSRPEFVVVRE